MKNLLKCPVCSSTLGSKRSCSTCGWLIEPPYVLVQAPNPTDYRLEQVSLNKRKSFWDDTQTQKHALRELSKDKSKLEGDITTITAAISLLQEEIKDKKKDIKGLSDQYKKLQQDDPKLIEFQVHELNDFILDRKSLKSFYGYRIKRIPIQVEIISKQELQITFPFPVNKATLKEWDIHLVLGFAKEPIPFVSKAEFVYKIRISDYGPKSRIKEVKIPIQLYQNGSWFFRASLFSHIPRKIAHFIIHNKKQEINI